MERQWLVGVLAAGALAASVVATAPTAVADGGRPYLDLVYSPDEVVEVEDLTYGRAVDWQGEWQDLLLDVHYVPTDGATARPAVVWVHGGYFLDGSKDSDYYAGAIAELARSGYVVAAINYRLQGGDFPRGIQPELFTEGRVDEYLGAIRQAQHDAQAAIRWVRLHADEYGVDPDRVAIVGHSAGGLTATAVAMNADDDPGNSGSPGPSSIPNAAVASAGTGLPGRQLHIDAGDTPILFAHGVLDDVVPYPTVLPTCSATLAVGNVCEQVLDLDGGHEMFGFAEIREFLDRFLVERPGLILPTNLTVLP